MIGIGVFVVMVFVVAGLAGGVGFMVGRGRAAVAEEQARRWQEAADQLRRERDAAGEKADIEKEAAVEKVRIERDAVTEQARRDRESAGEQLEVLHEKVRTETAARARAEADLTAAEGRYDEQIELLRNEKESIKRMAAEVLEVTNGRWMKQLTDMVDQRAQATGQELDQRRKAIDELIKPLSTQVSTLTEYVRGVEKDRVGSYAALGERLQQLSTDNEQLRVTSTQAREETARLVSALRRPHTRGKWGEQQLRNVVDAAGMLNHVDFAEQPSLTDGDATLRPDMTVRIGGQMTIVVDAKTPFNAFLDAHDARDADEHKKLMASHIKTMRRHIDQLSDKQYWDLPDHSPELVVMFVPSEVFLYEAWEQDPELWRYAVDRKVVLATPTSLLTMLKSVAMVLRQEAMAENARVTAAMCAALTKHLRKVAGELNKLGTKLGGAVNQFNVTVNAMEREVLPAARQIEELQGADAADAIPAPSTVDRVAKTLALPEATETDGSRADDQDDVLEVGTAEMDRNVVDFIARN
ncbi:DNA recombination protein RmuC [Nocardia sp. NPDC057663]|uniref:DNA recombination protein RmuC n=1 Tax=Nocardia sp. NPDC057663 TaxID=3346201 RepID=UPI00366C6314